MARALLDYGSTREQLGNLSASTLARLIKRGELPVVRIGRRSLIPQDAVDALIRRGTTRGNSTHAARRRTARGTSTGRGAGEPR